MFEDYLILKGGWYSSKCSLTWKPLVTKSKRILFQLAPSTPRTAGTGSGLLRTPDANMERGQRSEENLKDRYLVRKMPLCLNDQIAMHEKNLLATPQASDATMGSVIGKVLTGKHTELKIKFKELKDCAADACTNKDAIIKKINEVEEIVKNKTPLIIGGVVGLFIGIYGTSHYYQSEYAKLSAFTNMFGLGDIVNKKPNNNDEIQDIVRNIKKLREINKY